MSATGGITRTLDLEINGERRTVAFPVHHTLLEVLREECALTGTKHGCELGECGACAVLVDGKPVLSCLVLAADMEGKRIETIEGMADGPELDPLQAALADLGAAQCGYCTPGILLTSKALLAEHPRPDRRQVEEALAGNLCRCTGYHKIVEGVLVAADPKLSASLEDAEARPEILYGAAEPAAELPGDPGADPKPRRP